MTTVERDTRCPHCGTETGIERAGAMALPGGLYLEEFEILVRNEWRRRLGPDSYVRAHETRLIRALAAVAMAPGPVDGTELLMRELEPVLSDLAAAGRGRRAVRKELRHLFKAVRAVLIHAGGAPVQVEAFTATTRRALDIALGYPTPA